MTRNPPPGVLVENHQSIGPDGAAAAPRLGYLPALDGLRALAVLGVLLYHGGNGWLPGGYLGVDFFFTLSGFLITTLLILEWRSHGHIALGTFYVRRARRLLPALFVCLGLIGVYTVLYASPLEMARVRGDTWSAVLYVSNWRMVLSSQSYFEQFLAPSPFSHLWSLAIEEQWYLLWPLAMIGLLYLTRAKLVRLGAVIGVLAVFSAAWMAWLAHSGATQTRIYVGTDTRAQSLLVGAGVAVLIQAFGLPSRHITRVLLQMGAFASLGAILITWWQLDASDTVQYRFGYLAHALGVAVIIVAACVPGPVRTAFSPAPLRYIGKISYGLYLYHWPLYLVLTPDRTGLVGVPLFALRIAVSTIAAALSYHFIEMPIRRGALRGWVRLTLGGAVAACIVALLVTTTYLRVPGSPTAQRDIPPASGTGRLEQPIPASGPPMRVLIYGDSLARSLAQAYPQLAREHLFDGIDGGRIGCGFAEVGQVRTLGGLTQDPTTCGDTRSEARRIIADAHPQVVVLFGGVWEMADRTIDGTWYRYPNPTLDAAILDGWNSTIAIARAAGAQPVIATTPYFQRSTLDGMQPPDTNPRRVDHLNTLLRTVGAQTNTPVIDTNAFLSPNGRFARAIDG
ncbi:MAG: acyltransferase family protein, partial [Acidimicrobiia bacterium]